MYIYTPLCRYWIALYRYVLVFIVPHVDIELEDNKQFISNVPRILHISAQNIDCGYSLELPQWDSSNKYPQSMFFSKTRKKNVYSCKSQFYYIKVGFKGVKII